MIKWLLLTLIALLIQGIFALFEMACVSFNKVRLQYYVSRGERRAIWIQFLLKRPSRLFGTTLIGINAALQFGSECARRFYESIHLDPDWAPITQVFIVVLFGELVPMTTARRHPERLALFFVPLMAFLAKLLSPFTWGFDRISRFVHWMMSKPSETPLFLSREEVKMAFEERDAGEDEFNAIISSVFQLKNLTASQLMQPLALAPLFPSTATVDNVRQQIAHRYTAYFPIYHRVPHNVVSIVNLRDILRLSSKQKILDQGKSPWFVTKDTSILQILDQFRRNNQSVAVILETSGQACGILTLDQIVDTIFGPEAEIEEETLRQPHLIHRTLEGTMTIAEFNRQFKADLPGDAQQTLSDLLISQVDHPLSRSEMVRIAGYEFTVIEPTLRGVKTLYVHSLQE